ncbi:MAG: pseudouridine synthase [Eubacterium sp.]
MTERLDKILSRQLNITRTQAKDVLRSGRVAVNDVIQRDGSIKCGDSDAISVDGRLITVARYVYIMMNKPGGVISASDGKGERTVVDLVPENMQRRGLFPAGRLDRDTTGFVLITDDGEFAHNILSPAHHIPKTYIATLDKPIDDDMVADFEGGMTLNGEVLLEAQLEAVNSDGTVARVVLRQGLYHQVKRMFAKHGATVLRLHRTAMGSLELDNTLRPGECRYLTEDEIGQITKKFDSI